MWARVDYWVSGACSAIGAALSYLYGDITTLVVCCFGFIVMDYISGILVAISRKELSSEIGFKGLAKKMHILLMIGLGNLLDTSLNLGGVAKSLVCCFYIANEGISIVENAHNLGLPVPKKLIEILLSVKRQGEETDENKEDTEEDKPDLIEEKGDEEDVQETDI